MDSNFSFDDTPRHDRHVCMHCHRHRSLYRYRGRVRADRHHSLCFRCYRSHLDRWAVLTDSVR